MLSFEDSADLGEHHLRVTARVVRIEDGKVRNVSESSWRNPSSWAADFQVNGSAVVDPGTFGDGFYGWRFEYQGVYSINLERAELMAKTLKRITRTLARQEPTMGRPRTFAQFLIRVACALGITGYGWVVDKGRGWSWDDADVRWSDAPGAEYHIDHELREFRQRHAPAPAVEVA